MKCFVILILFGCVIGPPLGSSHDIINRSENEMQRFLERIEPKLELLIPDGAPLSEASVSFTFDDSRNRELICIIWDLGGSFIEIQFEKETMELVFFCNPSLVEKSHNTMTDSTEDNIWQSVAILLNKFPELSDCINSNEAILKKKNYGETGWIIEWLHYYNGIRVKDDLVRLVLDHSGTQVVSLTINWHDIVHLDTSVHYSEFNPRDLPFEINQYTQERIIVIMENKPRLAFVYSAISDFYIVDAHEGCVLFHDYYLGYLDSYRGWEADMLYPPEYGSHYERIKWRFKCTLMNNETHLARYFYEEGDVSREAILARLENEQVFGFHGHGHEEWYNGRLYTRLLTSTSSLMPFHVSAKDLSCMDLAFLAACMTSATSANGYPVYKNMAQGFLDGGAKCVVGFNREIYHGNTINFKNYFFDKAVDNSYSFYSCFVYAETKVPDIADASEIFKKSGVSWSNLHLQDNDGGDSDWHKYLGSGPGSPETHWYNNWESLWGEWDSVDHFRFEVTGGVYKIRIWAKPLYQVDMDIEIRVYDSNHQLITPVNSRGIGGEEEWNTANGYGVYYFEVIKIGTYNDPHAGAYQWKVDITS